MAARGDREVKCKYCDADSDTTPGGIEMWECGTFSFGDGVTMQSGLCQKNELARYRAMFPVPPWGDSPITPEVCERLGMPRTSNADELGVYAAGGIEVEFTNIGPDIWFRGTRLPESEYTVGQLSLLVATQRKVK